MQPYIKMQSNRNSDVVLKVIPGHFVTPNSHINYYVDMTTIKTRQNEAKAVAAQLAEAYYATTTVDTILCMDGTEVIGAYLADELSKHGVLSMNAHKTIYIATPEYDLAGQMIFRENQLMMVQGKNVLLLLASATTGRTISRALDGVHYYGGTVSGISAIFSAVSKVAGMAVNKLFSTEDIPDYKSYSADNCALCKAGIRVDAICNGFGYSSL
ncbi:MAG: orotate phosphoribosyltransferase [Lachnospiraceae bacterium]|nr:orotate phosphoribosyltransferase [Lachnospiraceae bacterium]